MSLTVLAAFLLAGCLDAEAGDPPQGYEVQQEQVQVEIEQAAEEVSETAQHFAAMVCRFKDVDAVAARAPDIPHGWVVPDLLVYEADGATCSQIPARHEAELIARAAMESAPPDAPAVQEQWTVEEIWAQGGGPPAP